MAENIENIHNNVRFLLTKFPDLRSPFRRKQAHFRYWQEFGEAGKFGITEEQYCKAVSAETISRAVRKIQGMYPELRPLKEDEFKKYEMADSYRKIYSKIL
uniref:Uncharacterized protein n=1 Tax=viral metagenome TaxID=1070528 RepID=A0A6M3KZC2_9ZZZZ